jgi:two-component system nitrate/nitrite response regulator NarL
VVGIARNGHEMIAASHQLQPDVIVTDIEMPEMSGIEAGREVLRTRPDVPIVLLTMHADRKLLEIALEAGFRGYVLKLNAGKELPLAIYEVMAGRIFISPALRSQ